MGNKAFNHESLEALHKAFSVLSEKERRDLIAEAQAWARVPTPKRERSGRVFSKIEIAKRFPSK